MPFPDTRRTLKEAGYDFITNKTCQCGATIELWHTPKDQVLPMNVMEDDDAKAESHFSTCPKAAQFRRKKPAASASDGSAPGQTPRAAPSGAAQTLTTRSENQPPARRPDGQE